MSITNTLVDNQNQITLINLYSEDNPILEIGDETYFIFFNALDYHIPLIGKGTVYFDRFNDTINKHYFICIKELLNSKSTHEKFIVDKQIQLYTYNKENLNMSTKPRVYRFNDKFEFEFFDDNLIKIECFFVRKTLAGIQQLQKDFLEIINNDTLKILNDIKEVQNNL